MADQGRREVVPDQLAFNAREQTPERSLAVMGVRNPGMSGGAVKRNMMESLNGLQAALGEVAAGLAGDAVTEGKLMYMQGATEKELLDTGNRNTRIGYEALSSIDQANSFQLNAEQGITDGDYALDPEEYRKKLMDSRAQALAALPDDPDIKKLYVSAFEQSGPALAAKQFEAHNNYIGAQQDAALGASLRSTSAAAPDATRVMPGSALRVSQARIDTAIMYNDSDRDTGILTMLGEAGGEGDVGLAAVAHVLKNRVTDNRWGGTVSSVAKAPKQFSTWNTGAGGNGPEKWRGTKAYERAGAVYDAVMQGYTADMTNGATHYYSPAGMKKLVADGAQGNLEPGWLATETARSGGGIKIGGHIFAGKSGMAGYTPLQDQEIADATTGQPVMQQTGPAGTPGKLTFLHPDQKGIDPGFANILTETSAALGYPLKITSGYRSPDHPVEAAKKSPGEHSHKDASDIDMSGMSDEQKKGLITELRSRGVKRFITYSGSPNMLHVDMNSKGGQVDQNGNWFMYDRSNSNLGKSPAWFQEVANSANGVPSAKSAQPSVRVLLTNAPGNPARKASVLASEMQRQLDAGSDQLFNDAGGVGVLYEMGAKPQDIDGVLKAKERQEKKQLDGYDTDFERQRSDLMTSVQNGKFATKDQVISAVDELYKSKKMNGSQAQSLVRAAQSEWEKLHEGEDAVLPKEFMFEAERTYRKVDLGIMTASDAYDHIAEVSAQYGVSPKTSQGFLKRVLTTDDGRYTRDRNDALELAKKTAASDDLKTRAKTALAQDKGLNNLPDGTVDDNGIKKPVMEYAIDQLKASIKNSVNEGIINKQISEDDAGGILYKQLYTKLAKNGIVDKQGSDAFQAAARGDFTEKVDGKIVVRADAKDAFNAYMMMKNTPDIGDAYAASMFPDPQVRAKMEQSARMYSLNMDIDTAMLKAQQQLSDPNFNPTELSSAYYGNIDKKVDEAIKISIGNNGFFSNTSLAPFFNTVSGEYEKSLLTTERGKASAYIRDRADNYNSINPRQDPEVSIKMAMQDFENNSIQVRGQMLIGDSSRNRRLDQVMGLSKFGKQAPEEAINELLEARGKEMWPEYWDNPKYGRRPMTGAASLMPVNLTFDQNTGLIGFQFLDQQGTPKGATHYMDAEDIGTYYKKTNSQPSWFAKKYDSFTDTFVPSEQRDAARAGGEIGEMVQPQ